MKSRNPHACEAWELLLKLFFSQRADLPALAAEFDLSPVQCHVLRLIEPGQPLPMGRIAETLACDASNVTGLVDRLEARGLHVFDDAGLERHRQLLWLTPMQKGRIASPLLPSKYLSSVQFRRQLLAAQALVVTLDGGGELSLALRGGLFVKLPRALHVRHRNSNKCDPLNLHA